MKELDKFKEIHVYKKNKNSNKFRDSKTKCTRNNNRWDNN